MRIITGSLKGRRLDVPDGVDIRPTSDFAKGGIFNVLDARKGLAGARVLDLFSGTGNLAIEAISRGAASAVTVEVDRTAANAISKTATRFGIDGQVVVVNTEAATYLGRSPIHYDVVFADPPYDYADMPGLADTVLGSWLATDGWFILEHDVRHNFSTDPRCVFSKPYGKTIVSIFKL